MKKDLGDITENFESEVENLKNTEMKLFGITMTPATITGAVALVGSIIGGLYGAFEVYKDYMGMKEIIQTIDTTEIENKNKQIEIKLDEAIDYSRAIKNDLRDDFNRMEKNIDRIEDQQRNNDDKVKDMIDRASERFDVKRESLQSDTEIKIRSVEDRLNRKIQQALDNPLAN